MKEANRQEENVHPQKKNLWAILSNAIGIIAGVVIFFELKIGIIFGLIGLILGFLALRQRQKLAWIGIVINGLIVVVPLILILYLLIEVLLLYSQI